MKIALIVGFLLVLFVTVLISDHLSKARQSRLDQTVATQPQLAPSIMMTPPANPMPLPVQGGENGTDVRLASAPTGSLMGGIGGGVGGGAGTLLPADSTTPPPAPAANEAPTIEHPKPVELTLGKDGNSGEALRSNRFATSPLRGTVAMDITTESRVSGKDHVVGEGESLYRIAKDTYGDGSLWRRLVDANPGKITADGGVRVGTTIVLPTKDVLLGRVTEPKAEPSKPTRVAANVPAVSAVREAPGRKTEGKPTASKGRTYVVQKGDTLGEIAQKQLGTSKRASELLKQNASVLKDPGAMKPGMVLTLPNG